MGKIKLCDVLLILLSIILPFIVVFLKCGCGKDLLIDILLCLLLWIPGVVYAIYVVVTKS